MSNPEQVAYTNDTTINILYKLARETEAVQAEAPVNIVIRTEPEIEQAVKEKG